MNKAEKLKRIQELQNRLDDIEAKDPIGSVERLLGEEAKSRANPPSGDAIKVLARGLAKVQKDPRPDKLSKELESTKEEHKTAMEELSSGFLEKLDTLAEEVKSAEGRVQELTSKEVTSLQARLAEFEGEFSAGLKLLKEKDESLEEGLTRVSQELPKLSERLDSLPDHAPAIQENTESVSRVTESTEELRKAIEELDVRITSRISRVQEERHGNGNMNRQILVGGDKDTLSKFTDINLKAGAGTTITYAANATTQSTDITITATGSGSGITRSIQTVAVNTAAANSPSIDYVYLASGTVTITLPTTVGNSNLYTIKNIGAGTVTIATTGGETIDGSANLILPLQFTSVDLISNNSGNWDIT